MKTTFYFSLLLIALTLFETLLPTRLAGNGYRAAAADLIGYTLVNADTDLDIQPLTNGAVLDLATLPTRNLNIRANTNPATVGSVVFNLSGAQARTATENFVPYALFSDYQGDYFPWTPPLGNYTLTATPFDGTNGTGAAGTPLTLNFSVISSGGAISSFTLVNADTDLDVLTMATGSTLNLALLPRNLNIRANANAVVVSVELSLTGAQTRFATENVVPYALFSDFQGDYFPWSPAPVAGTYTLTATPFDAPNGGGTAGTPLTIIFTFTGTSPLPVQLTDFVAKAQGPAAVLLNWTTASEKNNREFEVQRSVDGKTFGVLGRVAGHGSTASAHAYRYTDEQLPANTVLLYYRLRQVDNDGTATFSPVRTVARKPYAAALEVYSPVVPDGLLHYAYTGPIAGGEQLEVYSMLGQRYRGFPLAAAGPGTLSVAGLPSGVYVLRVATGAGYFTGRFVLP